MKTAMQELEEIVHSRFEYYKNIGDYEAANRIGFIHSWIIIQGIPKENHQLDEAYNKGMNLVQALNTNP